MKLLDFDNGINVSIGLPIIRTSVDHGTAFDIAGKNVAEAASMKGALRLGALMAERKMAAHAIAVGYFHLMTHNHDYPR